MILSLYFKISVKCVCLTLCFVLLSLVSCNEIPTENSLQSEVVFANANIYLDKEHSNKVRNYLDSSINIDQNSSPQDLLKKYQLLVKLYYYHQPNYAEALLYIDSIANVLANLPSSQYKKEQIFMLLHKGRIAIAQKEFDKAFLFHYKAKLIIDEIKDTCQVQMFSFALAELLFKQEAYRDAISFFKESYIMGELCSRNNDKNFLHERLITPNNIALCYERLNILDSALYYYQLGLQAVQNESITPLLGTISQNKAIGVYYGNLGGLMLKLNKTDLARTYLQNSIALNYDVNMDMNDAILTKIKLAKLTVGLGEILNSKFLLSSIQNDLIIYPNIEAEIRLADVLKDYFKLVGDYYEADKYQKIKDGLLDSIRVVKNPNFIKKAFVNEFEDFKNTVDLANLKREDKIKSLLLVASLITVFLGGLIIMIFAYNRKQNKKHIIKLEEVNTELNVSNQKLELSLNSLEVSYLENERLTKAVAHDMRSPLVAVVGVLDLLCTEDLDEESKNNLLIMAKESSQKGLGVLDDVLKSKVDISANLTKDLVSIKGLIESSVSVINQQASFKNQQLVIDIVDVKVNINESKMWRVINNLLGNAVKFSPDGAKIEIATAITSNNVIIKVRDYGIGIPENLRENLFDFFTKASRKGTNGEATHGLGLAISKQIVEAHYGKIWFESEANVGTTFFVRLPI